MPRRILVVPDKFKGTLTAQATAEAIARGWKKVHPGDALDLLPMSDGGDGFGEIISGLIHATPQKIKTIDAAHRKIEAIWWWNQKTKTAVIESAKIIGIAMLPPKQFHPFELDTFGLGTVLLAAAKRGAQTCFVGIGGSATNDAGFGMARRLGWKFLNSSAKEIQTWTGLDKLDEIVPPKKARLFKKLIIAVDVENPLLGKNGCSRIYGPQKGLRPEDFTKAEASLHRVAAVAKKQFRKDFAKIPGAGAAGGLGFGLMSFASGRPESGFDIFAEKSQLKRRIRAADLVLTGEGSLDEQTLMGKGVGRIALLCRKTRVPCIGLAGLVTDAKKSKTLFAQTRSLTEITTLQNATREAATYLEQLASNLARTMRS